MAVKAGQDPPPQGGADPATPPAGAAPPTMPPPATPPAGAASPPTAPPATPPASAASVLGADDVAAGAKAEGSVIEVPQEAFKTIKAKAKAAGKKEAETQLLAPILAAGFTSVEELIEAAKSGGKDPQMSTTPPAGGAPAGTPPAGGAPVGGQPAGAAPGTPPAGAPATPPAGAAPPGTPAPDQRALTPEQRKSLRDARDKFNADLAARDQAIQAEQAKFQAAQTELAKLKAATAVGYKIAAAGCVDVDWTLKLYEEHRATLDEAGVKALEAAAKPASKGADGKEVAAELSGFDKWLGDLKKAKPHLFAGAPTVAAPASTGPGAAPPATPGAAQVAGAVGDGGKVDYRKMTPDQRREYDRGAGLRG